MPRVSIITALYNHEKYLATAIDSVLAQTFSDWEYLIVDDASSDNSLALAREYAARSNGKIKVFTHEGGKNLGQERTRNVALEKSSGELICLLDSDDYYLPKKLELLVPCFSDSDVGLAYGKFRHWVEASGNYTDPSFASQPSGRVFEPLVRENFIGAGATLFRRETIETGLRFDPAFRTIGEYPLWLKIAKDWKLAHVAEPVAVWRDHGKNLGKALQVRAKEELVELCQRLLRDEEYALFRPAIESALLQRQYDFASELYSALELGKAHKKYGEVMRKPDAPAALKLKSALFWALSSLGHRPNAAFLAAKRLQRQVRSRF